MFNDFSLKKGLRLRKYSEFKTVFLEQKKSAGRAIVVYFKPDSILKFGVIVSKKVDKRAVVRNKIKRRLREIFRNNKPEIKGHYVVVSKSSAKDVTFEELNIDWIKQLSFLKKRYG